MQHLLTEHRGTLHVYLCSGCIGNGDFQDVASAAISKYTVSVECFVAYSIPNRMFTQCFFVSYIGGGRLPLDEELKMSGAICW